MKYKCRHCNFIHFGSMPDGYICPLCHAGLFDFDLIEEEEKVYNRVETDERCVVRVEEKCRNCGACFKTCEKVLASSDRKVCLGCGQCILTCPFGALIPKYDYLDVLDLIRAHDKKVIAITSPAVRVALGDAFNMDYGTFLEKKMVGALKAVGFDMVFDTSFGADLTSIYEARELDERLDNKKNLPMFSSCCPSWVSYANSYVPLLKKNLSSCKSPIGMIASVLKKYYYKDAIIVAITPCTSKKLEIVSGDADYVLTTSELSNMIRETGLVFEDIKDANFDSFSGSGSGTYFGTSGGVTLSVLKCLYYFRSGNDLSNNEVLVKDKEFYKEYRLKIGRNVIRCASVSTMGNLLKVLLIKDEFDFIEVMNCEGGCIFGGGQVVLPANKKDEIIKARALALKKNMRKGNSFPYKNPLVSELCDKYGDELDGVLHN